MWYLKLVCRGDEFTTIPKAGSWLDGQGVDNHGYEKSNPSGDDIYFLVSHVLEDNLKRHAKLATNGEYPFFTSFYLPFWELLRCFNSQLPFEKARAF
ncbi:MAG: hypothetical protein ACJAZM_003098 [Cyclobacteriaceae bacterium]|jgi:hypothetical protein